MGRELGPLENNKIGVKHSKDKLPLYIVLMKQFPLSIQELAKCSLAGHKKYIEGDEDWLNFTRVENPEEEYKNASLRHMMKEGYNQDMSEYGLVLHEAQAIWNQMAALEIKLKDNIKS